MSNGLRRSETTCPHCDGHLGHRWDLKKGSPAYEHVPSRHDDIADENAAEQGMIQINDAEANDSKETFHSALQKQKSQHEVQASSSKDPRPSTDDETARLL